VLCSPEFDDVSKLLFLVPNIIAAWDLTEDDGTPIPVTTEAILVHNLPIALLNQIVLGVTEHRNGVPTCMRDL
jgi:hypothetical protein